MCLKAHSNIGGWHHYRMSAHATDHDDEMFDDAACTQSRTKSGCWHEYSNPDDVLNIPQLNAYRMASERVCVCVRWAFAQRCLFFSHKLPSLFINVCKINVHFLHRNWLVGWQHSVNDLFILRVHWLALSLCSLFSFEPLPLHSWMQNTLQLRKIHIIIVYSANK